MKTNDLKQNEIKVKSGVVESLVILFSKIITDCVRCHVQTK